MNGGYTTGMARASQGYYSGQKAPLWLRKKRWPPRRVVPLGIGLILLSFSFLIGCDAIKEGLFGEGASQEGREEIHNLKSSIEALISRAAVLEKEGVTPENTAELTRILLEVAQISARIYEIAQRADKKGPLDWIGWLIGISAGSYLGTRQVRLGLGKVIKAIGR